MTELIEVETPATPGMMPIMHARTAQSGVQTNFKAISPGIRPEPEEVREPIAELPPVPVTVPDGTASEIIGWVGGDPDRAQLALDAENASGDPRKRLVNALQRMLDRGGEVTA